MTGSQMAAFALWLATIVMVSVLLLSVAPALARTLFRERLDAIIDDCRDALLDDRLASSPAVDAFLADVHGLKKYARQLTLHRVGMIVVAMHEIGVDFSAHHSPSYAQLRPAERKLLHELMARTNHALASYLRWGSPAGLLLAPLAAASSRWVGQKRRRPARALPAMDVERVAEQFNQAGAVNDLLPRHGRPHLVG